jgi:hypothetical protein
MSRRSRMISTCVLAGAAVGLLGAGYWFGAGSMVYSTNCELRHIAEACAAMRSLQNWGAALIVGSLAPVAALILTVRRKN